MSFISRSDEVVTFTLETVPPTLVDYSLADDTGASSIDQVSLECADSHVPHSVMGILKDKVVLVGAVAVTPDRIETPEQVADTIRSAMRYVDPERVLLISGRFDRVIPPRQTEALWEELGRPRWIRLPVGHYQVFPFFWWAVGRGADHLDRVL